MHDLGSISNELQSEPQDLRSKILQATAKLKGLDLLTGVNAFQRDQERLDARQRAYYRKLGLELKGDDETAIQNILGDNINISQPDRPASQQDERPSTQTTGPKRRLLPWLLAAGLTGANIAGGAWVIKNIPQPVNTNSRTTIGLSTK